MENKAIGLFLIGIALGRLLPALPEPAVVVDPFLPFIFIAIAIVFLIKA